MDVSKIYRSLTKYLTQDEKLMTSLGIGMLDYEQQFKRIQQRRLPSEDAILPMMSFYTPGGAYEGPNDNMYVATFVFDCYTLDSPVEAQAVGSEIHRMFNRVIPNLPFVASYESKVCTQYESPVQQIGLREARIYCWTTIVDLSVSDVEPNN